MPSPTAQKHGAAIAILISSYIKLKYYHTVKNFGGKRFGKFGELQQFAKFFVNFYNFHNIAYHFTIIGCPSMLKRFLDLPLFMP